MEWIVRVRPQRKADPKPFLNVSAVPSLHSGFFCVVSLGLNYIFMGQADEDGRGMIAPHHFIMVFKAKNQRAFNMLKNKRCWALTDNLWSQNPHIGVWLFYFFLPCMSQLPSSPSPEEPEDYWSTLVPTSLLTVVMSIKMTERTKVVRHDRCRKLKCKEQDDGVLNGTVYKIFLDFWSNSKVRGALLMMSRRQ